MARPAPKKRVVTKFTSAQRARIIQSAATLPYEVVASRYVGLKACTIKRWVKAKKAGIVSQATKHTAFKRAVTEACRKLVSVKKTKGVPWRLSYATLSEYLAAHHKGLKIEKSWIPGRTTFFKALRTVDPALRRRKSRSGPRHVNAWEGELDDHGWQTWQACANIYYAGWRNCL